MTKKIFVLICHLAAAVSQRGLSTLTIQSGELLSSPVLNDSPSEGAWVERMERVRTGEEAAHRSRSEEGFDKDKPALRTGNTTLPAL
jgi:hypothetical protein